MHFVLISILCSVGVSILIKLARRRKVSYLQLIVWNYPISILCSYFFLNVNLSHFELTDLPWSVYIALGVLLPSIFVYIAKTIRYSGIAIAEVAQRVSLFIPLLAAGLLFHEQISINRILGIALGFLAIALCVGWQKGASATKDAKNYWLYPLLVFLGMGVIDVLFKKVATYTTVSYTNSLFIIFVIAFFIALLYLFFWLKLKKHRFDWKAIFWGMSLGVLNFGNILFYMKAHKALPDNPSVVFTAMNIGVMSLGAVVGVLVFGEKLSKINKLGLLLAIVAVLIITINE